MDWTRYRFHKINGVELYKKKSNSVKVFENFELSFELLFSDNFISTLSIALLPVVCITILMSFPIYLLFPAYIISIILAVFISLFGKCTYILSEDEILKIYHPYITRKNVSMMKVDLNRINEVNETRFNNKIIKTETEDVAPDFVGKDLKLGGNTLIVRNSKFAKDIKQYIVSSTL